METQPGLSRSPLSVVVIAMGVTAAVLAGLYARASLSGDDMERPLLTVETQVVEKGQNLIVDHWFSGRIEPRQRLQVASELAGKIERVYVDEGDAVTAGDVLLALDTSILESERRRLQASLSGLQAERELAERRLKRQRELKIDGFSATDTIDEIETSLKQLSSRQATLKAQIDGINIQLEKSVVSAPFDASVQQRFIDVGAVINPGTPILELLESGVGELKVGVPVEVARTLTAGDSSRVLINNNETQATVLSVAPAVDLVTQTVPVRLELQGNDFRFGEYANLHFTTTARDNGFWIPNAALVEDERGLWSVFAVNAENRVTRYSANIVYADNVRAFVGINGQDTLEVVVSGLNRVTPGMTVAVR